MSNNLQIVATAYQLPEQVVTNDALSQLMDTSDEWIYQRTGIKQRHVAATENTSDLCTAVAKQLLVKAALPATAVDLIVVATMSPDYLTPGVATMVQGNLQATNATCFDINVACSGFVSALQVVNQYLINNPQATAMLIGGEVLSKLLDWHDRTTAVLFGDGAGGVLLQAATADSQYLADDFLTLGDQGKYLTSGYINTTTPFRTIGRNDSPFFKMDGHKVYNFATKNVPLSIKRALKKADLTADQVDHYLLHQANARIIKRIAKALAVDEERFALNIASVGNTAAASEPILLAQMVAQGQINRGDTVVLAGFGGGLALGTIILKY